MFSRQTTPSVSLEHLERVEAAVRARYGIGADQIVLVSEEPARLPGGPERMTTILFWNGDSPDTSDRHKLRVFKPAAHVAASDLPPGWLRGALLDEGEPDCC